MKFLYQISFLLGMDNWDIAETPSEILDTIKNLPVQKGTALDIGCGKGKHSIRAARLGWQVIGLDYVGQAVQTARKNADKAGVSANTQFRVADVTHLEELGLPPLDFAFDIGCFHLLGTDDQANFIGGLAKTLPEGSLFLMHAFSPRQQGKKQVGFSPKEIESLFKPDFSLEKITDKSYWRFPANWYWLRRV